MIVRTMYERDTFEIRNKALLEFFGNRIEKETRIKFLIVSVRDRNGGRIQGATVEVEFDGELGEEDK